MGFWCWLLGHKWGEPVASGLAKDSDKVTHLLYVCKRCHAKDKVQVA